MAVDEDGDARAEGVGFFHGVSGEDGGAVFEVVQNDVPEEAARRGVHSRVVLDHVALRKVLEKALEKALKS